MHASRFLFGALLGLTFGTVGIARSETPATRLHRAFSALPDGGTRAIGRLGGSAAPPLLVRTESRAQARARGLIPITDELAVGHVAPQGWEALEQAEGVRRVFLSPFRFPLLDRVSERIELDPAHNDAGLRGEGTIIGVVDTGGDAAHPALLDADGKSRIAWFLAYGQEPLGLHPELEEEYDCAGEVPCAILSGADLDEIIESRVLARLPKDPIGHGTHITSIAAGRDDEYPGVAPAAGLILVAAAEPDGAVSDARILLGAKFVFDRAAEMNMPAVVNVSLGSSFGAHDGTSSVEQGLFELARGPGRAIVLAAGNSGGVYENISPDYPGPFGVHTEVAVLPSSQVRVPILTPPGEGDSEGSVFIWISTRPGDSISVGFGNGVGSETELAFPGEDRGVNSSKLEDADDYEVVILNGVDGGLDADVFPGSIVVALVGSWRSGRTFEIILEGEGNGRMWVTGTGDVAPITNTGPLFPRARTRGTVAVPGSQRDLITVGSSINRNEWTYYTGDTIGYGGPSQGRSSFSAAGPNQNGALKPELVAPGGGVIGAMAREADPRTSLRQVSQFASFGACPDGDECFVIDDEHGIATGTSMAAPVVTGAVALLMQRDPELSMERAKEYLMAGAKAVPGEGPRSLVGTGQLDIVSALIAQERDLEEETGEAEASEADTQLSRVVWADEFVYPGSGPALQGFLLTRDASDRPLPIDVARLSIDVEGPGRATWEPIVPGLVGLSVTGDEGTASQELTVITRIDGIEVSRQVFAIERDPILAEHGFELVGGTCSIDRAPAGRPRLLHLWALLLTGAMWRLGSSRSAQRRS